MGELMWASSKPIFEAVEFTVCPDLWLPSGGCLNRYLLKDISH